MKELIQKFKSYEAVNIGYARVSTEDQELGLLVQEEKLSDCHIVFVEKVSGDKENRKEFKTALRLAKELSKKGTSVIFTVYKLDRLTRRMRSLLEIIEELNKNQIKLVSIKENIETDSLTGRLLCLLLGYVAEMELNAIRDRTREGLQKAKAKGKKLGNKGISQETELLIIHQYQEERPLKEIAKNCQVSTATIYNVLNRHKIEKKRRNSCKNT